MSACSVISDTLSEETLTVSVNVRNSRPSSMSRSNEASSGRTVSSVYCAVCRGLVDGIGRTSLPFMSWIVLLVTDMNVLKKLVASSGLLLM